jgi:hypothetical protein
MLPLSDLTIYIPTFNRVKTQTTWSELEGTGLHDQTYLVCNADEAPQHAAANRQVLVHPPEITTIAAKRAWIVQNCPTRNLVMLDDDLRFFGRDRSIMRLRKELAMGKDLHAFFGQLNGMLETFTHGGFSHRLGNQQLTDSFAMCKRMMYVLAYQRDAWLKHVVPNRVEVREDFDYTLQLLRAGHPNVLLCDVAVQDAGYGAQAGGEAETRRVEFTNAQADLLAELHPGFVRVTEKDYLRSIKRKEVVVSWRKAYEEGQRGRNARLEEGLFD